MTTAVHHPPTTAVDARHNLTTTGRVVRVALGLTAAVVGALLLATPGAVLAYRLESLLVLVGLVLGAIGAIGYSPLYGLLGRVPAPPREGDPERL